MATDWNTKSTREFVADYIADGNLGNYFRLTI